jgi:hypothetical protein
LETLKELLHKTLKIAPRQKSALNVEIVLRSQGYDLMYHHMSGDELAALMESKAFKEMLFRGFKLTRNVVTLGGHQFSWRANDIGLPVGVGLATPGVGRYQIFYGNLNQTNKIGRFIQSNIDINLQVYQTN